MFAVSMPALRTALAAFSSDRMAALETLTDYLRISVSSAINDLLNAEMTFFLGQPDQRDNKRNGIREREYYLKGIGCLRIDLPRDRNGTFESVVIPAHERIDPRTKQDLALLHMGGLSKRTLSMISQRLLGMEVSRETVSESLGVMKAGATNCRTAY